MKSNDLLRGTLKTIILKMLADHGKMYGYELTQKVSEPTNGSIALKFGALYPILHKLEAEALLSTQTELHENRARKYYLFDRYGKESGHRESGGLPGVYGSSYDSAH